MSARILLVEDDELNREMLARRLTRVEFEVLCASDGEEAIALAVRERPALILLDMSLPCIDGYAAARQLKALPETRHIPIIGLSAHAMRGDREKALEAGCDEYETKPIQFDRLQALIRAALDRGR